MLWMEGNLINTTGCKEFESFLRCHNALKYLYLAHNAIADDGVAMLAPWCLKKLVTCDLSDNRITSAGMSHVADALRAKHCKIKTLCLESNMVGDEGAMMLADALRHNTSLKFMNLRFNGITERGMQAIRDVLASHNKTLRHLQLDETECMLGMSDSHSSYRHAHTQAAVRHNHINSDRWGELRAEIEFFLRLNAAGRRAFSNLRVPVAIFPHYLAGCSQDHSVMYALMLGRPDILERK